MFFFIFNLKQAASQAAGVIFHDKGDSV